jgi:hypothetical protein
MSNSSSGNENTSYSEENILANSIRIAREKISKMDWEVGNQNTERDLQNQVFLFHKPKK